MPACAPSEPDASNNRVLVRHSQFTIEEYFLLLTRYSAWIFCVGALFLAGAASSQNYPNKPIRLVTVESGGSADFAARIIALALSGSLGQHVIVDNRGGASGLIAIETVAKAQPDGYTLLLYSSALWILPLLQSVSYDSTRDFAPVTITDRSPNILVVNPSVKANSTQELMDLARARPGQLNYASGGSGTSTHLAAELFKAMAGLNLVRIPYKGGAPALNDVIGGQVQIMFASAAAVAPHIRSGRLKALAVTGAQPSALAPDLPTVAASGLAGYEAETIHGIFVPAATARLIINRLNEEIVRILNSDDVKKRFLVSGIEASSSSPEQLSDRMKSEMARIRRIIKDTGIRAN